MTTEHKAPQAGKVSFPQLLFLELKKKSKSDRCQFTLFLYHCPFILKENVETEVCELVDSHLFPVHSKEWSRSCEQVWDETKVVLLIHETLLLLLR